MHEPWFVWGLGEAVELTGTQQSNIYRASVSERGREQPSGPSPVLVQPRSSVLTHWGAKLLLAASYSDSGADRPETAQTQQVTYTLCLVMILLFMQLCWPVNVLRGSSANADRLTTSSHGK